MIILEKITVHPKKKGYYKLEFASVWERILLDVHEDVLIKYALRKGLEFSNEEFSRFKKAQEGHSVYLLAINYLSYRVRTEKEMSDYLRKKEVAPSVITETIDRLKEEKLLHDRTFAEMFVRSRKRSSTKGPRFILQELMQKGILEQDAIPALDQYSFAEQYDNAMKLAESRIKASDKLSNKERRTKIGQSLLQKGFNPEVMQAVLNDLPDEKSDNAEWDALCKQAEKASYKYRALDDRERNFKLKQFLYRKGFPADLINKYLEENIGSTHDEF